MTTNMLILGCALAAAFALGAGCGGKVIIDEGENGSGQGGATTVGSSGPGSSGPGSTGAVGQTSVGSTGSGGDPKSSCQLVCDTAQKAGCGAMDCFEDCVNQFLNGGECADEFTALLNCYIEHLDAIEKCGQPFACDSLNEAYVSCQSVGGCGPQSCAVDPSGGCSCSVACGETKYSADCSGQPGGQACVCSMNGTPVGKCIGENQCDVFQSCCGGILFGDGGG